MKTHFVADYQSHTAFNPVYSPHGHLIAVDLISEFSHPAALVAVSQEIALLQWDAEQHLATLQSQINTIEKHHDFFKRHAVPAVLSITEHMAAAILQSEFLLHRMQQLGCLELGINENFTDFKLGKENPILLALSEQFNLTLNNFGSGYAPAKAVYDNLFSRVKLDKSFVYQNSKRASFIPFMQAVSDNVAPHCRQLIVQGVDELSLLENITDLHFAGIQGALFPPVPEASLSLLINPPNGLSGGHC
ncbi:EAL domain-containing protein [Paramixta manurensis]